MNKIPVLVLAACCLALGLPAVVDASDRALLVGVGKYQLPGNDLPGIDKDVAAMRDVAHRLGFRDEDIRVLEDEAATRDAIRSAFSTWLRQGVRPQDRVLFYFSGHGTQADEQRSGDEEDGLNEVLVPYDFSPDPLVAVVDDDLAQWLAAIPSRHILVFIDSCHSGTATRAVGRRFVEKILRWPGMPAPRKGSRKTPRRGELADKGAGVLNYVSVTASADDETAGATGNGSLFTLGIARAVRDVGPNQPLTMLHIKDVATRVVAEAFRPDKVTQTPQIEGDPALFNADVQERLEASSPPPPPSTAPPPTAPPPPPSTPPDPWAVPADAPPPTTSNDAWNALENVVAAADEDRRLAVTTNQETFRVGDAMTISLTVPVGGYLNILNFGQGDAEVTVLFPNQYQSDNRVSQGTTISIPGEPPRFALRARLPEGSNEQKVLVVALVSTEPLNGFTAGGGQAFLHSLTAGAARSFVAEAIERDFYAGKVERVIRR